MSSKKIIMPFSEFEDDIKEATIEGYQEACRDVLSLLNGEIDIEEEAEQFRDLEQNDYKSLLFFILKNQFGK